jgi:cytochrome c oxidase subunit IV
MSLSYEEGKKVVFRGLLLLAAITVVEVLFALLAKGHLIHGFNLMDGVGRYAYMAAMIGASIYKAYFIIFEFMHMKYEVKGMAMSVLLPICLLVWAIIAFFQEGGSWGARREQIKQKNEEKTTMPVGKPQGALAIKVFNQL